MHFENATLVVHSELRPLRKRINARRVKVNADGTISHSTGMGRWNHVGINHSLGHMTVERGREVLYDSRGHADEKVTRVTAPDS